MRDSYSYEQLIVTKVTTVKPAKNFYIAYNLHSGKLDLLPQTCAFLVGILPYGQFPWKGSFIGDVFFASIKSRKIQGPSAT